MFSFSKLLKTDLCEENEYILGLTPTSTMVPSLVGNPRGGLLLPTAYTCPSNEHARQMSRLAKMARFVLPGSFSSIGKASTHARLSSRSADATMEARSHRVFRLVVKRDAAVPVGRLHENREDEYTETLVGVGVGAMKHGVLVTVIVLF